jgi:hypothetical protein
MIPPPKICIFTETYYPVVGGGETQAQALAEGLVANGLDVIVLPVARILRSKKRAIWPGDRSPPAPGRQPAPQEVGVAAYQPTGADQAAPPYDLVLSLASG